MKSGDITYAKVKNELETEGYSNNGYAKEDYDDNVCGFFGESTRRVCPRCAKLMQKSGQKADSNGVVKQRFLCPACKKTRQTPYNYFFPIDML